MIKRLAVVLAILCPFDAGAFSVATQNLYHYQTRFDERLAHLRAEARSFGIADIVGLQEAARWTGQRNLVDEFVSMSGYRGHYQSTNNFGVMNEGIALYSRLPASGLQSAELPATEVFSRQYINFGIFATDAGPVLVINAHTSPGSRNADRRIQQNRFILAGLKRAPKIPVLIVGDLNDSYASASLKVFRDAGFVDVLNGQGATYDPIHNPLVTDGRWGPSRLDYILYKPNQLRVVSAGIIHTRNWVSDHFGLRAEFARPSVAR